MNFDYDQTSDSLYVALSAKTSAESEQIAPGLVVDYDADGRVVGLDIEDASKFVNFSDIRFSGFMSDMRQ